METILKVQNLAIHFNEYVSWFKKENITVIKNLNVEICAGQMVAVVGASGSGKSLLAHGILGILPKNSFSTGEIFFEGSLLTTERRKEILGREIAFIPQSVTYLDPLMKVSNQIWGLNKKEKEGRNALKRYHLDETIEKKYPHELSGGMTRRVMLSCAVLNNSRLVIADEPTPGVHTSTAKKMLSHLKEIAEEGNAVMLITHELDLALEFADVIVVMNDGITIETVPVINKKVDFKHPYSQALIRALPQNEFAFPDESISFDEEKEKKIDKEVPR